MTRRNQSNRYHRRGRSRGRRLKVVLFSLLILLILLLVAGMIWLLNSKALITPN